MHISLFFFRKDYVLFEEILKDIESDEETKQDNHEKQQQKKSLEILKLNHLSLHKCLFLPRKSLNNTYVDFLQT